MRMKISRLANSRITNFQLGSQHLLLKQHFKPSENRLGFCLPLCPTPASDGDPASSSAPPNSPVSVTSVSTLLSF
ncbi:hypothetical protein RRG08_062794 [Elysia crispata]|uniref:Uncharacterized protein n=1 Tax=Elysia crispata TaxID=231223 RepID=A0AAE1E7U8_9GAST|nr:hypothetical protein RRG08_062794 [Elysia crispata]